MKIIINYLKPHFNRMIVGFVIKFGGTLMDLLLPWILAYIIDEVVPQNNINKVLLWGVAMFFCALFAVLGNIIANRMAAGVAKDATRVLRNDLFEKITSLSFNQMDSFTEASLISRMTSDTYNIHNVIGRMQRLGVRAPILLIGGIALTMTLDPILSLILVASLPLLGVVVFFVSKKGIPLYIEQQSMADLLVRKVRESITGIRVIKALSKTNYEEKQFEKINANVVSKEKKAAIVMAITNPVMNFLLNMGWVLIIIVGASRVNVGLTKPGTIIAFLTYFTIILNAMLSITNLFVLFSKATASANRIEQVLNTCEDLKQVTNVYVDSDTGSYKDSDANRNEYADANSYKDSQVPYRIEFDHVSFSYNKNYYSIEDVSFTLKKGQTLGIIGATGSGKTTIINLLMRFYDVDSGVIKIDGKDIRKYSHDEFYQKFGAVFQNDTLFEDTIYENINLGRELSDKQVEKAAEYAQILDHIKLMKNGFGADVSIKGANLSGGQKQRILIARALAKSPQILILDDSSSALDYKTDATLRNDIKKNFVDTTTIIVAQRVSSVMNSDIIIVVDEGKLVGKGTHEELLLTCQEYREISNLQLGK
ncbi:ATP-binding cassette, subfamily B [[Clostridium] fimetarium]|uniref:ATP-binding cassette, subfamily B n=2 Tax=[Clostridium] fimetarium TaxID=99656 RepID=A0A1I0QB95_9FIRM|nr:ATP-binding cassette, subfamily B [[Clostridium] fimetarium]